ncbi:hypothetical protein GCM10010430_44240 [Kitasatospora cystarginea]|uniref:Nudix hydrolase domain-containing protein n=1 Tax=Kitasatospora cystarginea TaxID=58350 RepID=A0ABN3EEK3_9ACTN
MPPTSSDIHQLVQAYLRRQPQERVRLEPLLALLGAVPEPTSRATLPAHVTCSAAVIRPEGQVLHIHHKATGLMICPGGHVETGDESLLATALREVHEEAGIAPGDLCLTPQILGVPVDIDINDIDPNPAKGEGAHQHWDFRFAFCLADRAEVALQAEEVTGAEWRPLERVASPSLRAKLLAAGINGQAEPVNASVLIHDGAGRYLFHLRDNYPGLIWAPGEWSLLGGGREPLDVTLTDTLLRELAEEAPGLVLDELQPFAVEKATGVDGLCVPVQIFTARWTGDPDDMPLNEGVMLRWFEPEMLHRLRLRPSTRDLVHRHVVQHTADGRTPKARPGGRAVRNVIGVHLYLEDGDGRVMLGLRHPDSAYAGNTWHFLAGHCEQESAVECLIREAHEEAGLVIDPADVEFAHAVHLVDAPGAQPRLGMVFRVRRWKGTPELREPDKCVAWQWWHPDALPEEIVPYARAAIDGIRADRPYTEMGW